MPNLSRREIILGAAILAGTSPGTGKAGTPAAMQAVTVVLLTSAGNITLSVALTQAPISATDFLKYIDAGAYTGGRFFRVVRPNNDRGNPHINVVQGGTRPGAPLLPPIRHETTAATGLRHTDGTISLTRDAPGTGSGAEFFVCVGDNPGLDYGGTRNHDRQGFAAFGHVAGGMEIIRHIWSLPAAGHSDDAYTAGQILTDPVAINAARRVRI